MEWVANSLASDFRRYAEEGELPENQSLQFANCTVLDEELRAAGSDGVRRHLR